MRSLGRSTVKRGVQLADEVWRQAQVRMQPPFDMWHLGMLLYRLASQPWPYTQPYWPPSLSDAHVLARLSQFHAGSAGRPLLPHEEAPLSNAVLHEVVSNLLAPTAEARWSAERLRKHLELNTTPLTLQGDRASQETLGVASGTAES